MSEVIVGNSDGSGSNDRINKPVGAAGERAVVDPHMARTKDGYGITIGHGPPTIVSRRATNHCIPSWLAVMNVDSMDDDVRHVLDGDARAIGDVHIGPASVDGLEAVHDQFLLEGDHHVALEYNPEGPVLDHGVP